MPFNEKQEEKHSTVWSTMAVEKYIDDINSGIERKGECPLFNGSQKYRKANLLFEYTQEEVAELLKCKNDVRYFGNHYAYCKNAAEGGAVAPITLRDYQEDVLDVIDNNRFSIILAARQSGKTISSSIYLAWYLLFNYDKNVFLTANKERTARDVLSKVQEIIENVPFFMKPGILKWGALDLKFDNGCKCIAESTTPRSGIGFTINLLYLDEFAHVEKNIIDEFYSNIMPTVTSLPDSKIIITSTPNGMNLFYEIYAAAEKGLNGFKPYRIDWWQVPDWDKNQRKWVKRDEEWMERTIAILGGEDRELGLERFGAQYGNSFLATGNLLISPNGLKRMEEDKIKFVQDTSDVFDCYGIEESKFLRWHPDLDVPALKHNDRDYFLISVDLSEGNGGDYLVSDIFRVGVMRPEDVVALKTPNKITDYVCLEQVGVWAHNYMSLKDFAKFLYILTHKVMYTENVKIVLEWNAFGGEVMNELGYVFGDKNEFSRDIILKFKRSLDSDTYTYGLRVNAENKKIHCQMMRTNTSCGRIIVHDIPTIKEFNVFGLRKSSYEAITGHDDLAMTCVNANAFFETKAFGWIADNVIAESGRMQELLDAMKDNGDVYTDYSSIYSAAF